MVYPLSHALTHTPDVQEAVRVSTPPLDEDTADGKPRAFFTSLTPTSPDETEDSSAYSSQAQKASHQRRHRNAGSAKPHEWWERQPQRAARRKQREFEFDVPEHLPSSPMCPANKKHASKGTGVCVYHGKGLAPVVD